MVDPNEASRQIIAEARRRAGRAVELAAQLAQMGILGPGGQPYSEASISSWIKGRSHPPAFVVLAAAKAYEISIDALLGMSRDRASERRFSELSAQVMKIRERVDAQLDSFKRELDRGARQQLLVERGWPQLEAGTLAHSVAEMATTPEAESLWTRIATIMARLEQLEAQIKLSVANSERVERRLDQIEVQSQYLYDEFKATSAALARLFSLLEQAGLWREETLGSGGEASTRAT